MVSRDRRTEFVHLFNESGACLKANNVRISPRRERKVAGPIAGLFTFMLFIYIDYHLIYMDDLYLHHLHLCYIVYIIYICIIYIYIIYRSPDVLTVAARP